MKNLKFKINFINHSKAKLSKKYFIEIANNFFKLKNISGIFELDLEIVDKDFIKKINKKYLKTNTVTDVLSFPIHDKNRLKKILTGSNNSPVLLGQIVICYPQAEIEAKEKKISLKSEIEFLFIHGMKHIIGIHHR